MALGEAGPQVRGRPWWHTAAACGLSLIVWMAVSFVVGGFLTVLQTILTVLRPGIVGALAAAAGGFAGVEAAEYVCDRWLRSYSGRAVFLALCCFFLADVAAEILYVPPQLGQIATALQLIVSVLAAYGTFWKRAA